MDGVGGRMGGRWPCYTARRQRHVWRCERVRLSEFRQAFVCGRFVLSSPYGVRGGVSSIGMIPPDDHTRV